VSATPGEQLWASTLPGGTATAEAVSADGMRLFVAGYLGTQQSFETVAYSAATGAQLWAKAYQAAGSSYSYPAAITVSPDGARVYVTGDTMSALGQGAATFAYDAGTGKQLWVSRYNTKGAAVSGLTVSLDGTTVYVTGAGRVSGRQSHPAVIAYAAATGRQRWLRYYTKVPADGGSVSPDGKTVYVTGSGGSSVLTVAYQATGTVKWATRYNNPYGGAGGGEVVLGPGGSNLYIVGAASNKSGHFDTATFAYRTATGKCLWLDRYNSRGGGGQIAMTPDGRKVILVATRNNGRAGGYAIASYSASTGATRWTRQAPVAADELSVPAGLVIDPHGDTVFVASSQDPGGYDTAAWSVADGTLLWTISYAPAKVYHPAAIALSGDGTRLFVTGLWPDHGITTVAYQT